MGFESPAEGWRGVCLPPGNDWGGFGCSRDQDLRGFPVIRGVFWGLQACSLALWGRVARTFGHPRRDVRRLLAPPRVIGEDLVALSTRIRGVSEDLLDFQECRQRLMRLP